MIWLFIIFAGVIALASLIDRKNKRIHHNSNDPALHSFANLSESQNFTMESHHHFDGGGGSSDSGGSSGCD